MPVITKVASDLVKTCSFSRITLRCGFFFVTNFYYLCYMEIEIGLTNGPIIGFSLNYADEEYPYDELVFYFLLAHITFKWNM